MTFKKVRHILVMVPQTPSSSSTLDRDLHSHERLRTLNLVDNQKNCWLSNKKFIIRLTHWSCKDLVCVVGYVTHLSQILTLEMNKSKTCLYTTSSQNNWALNNLYLIL